MLFLIRPYFQLMLPVNRIYIVIEITIDKITITIEFRHCISN